MRNFSNEFIKTVNTSFHPGFKIDFENKGELQERVITHISLRPCANSVPDGGFLPLFHRAAARAAHAALKSGKKIYKDRSAAAKLKHITLLHKKIAKTTQTHLISGKTMLCFISSAMVTTNKSCCPSNFDPLSNTIWNAFRQNATFWKTSKSSQLFPAYISHTFSLTLESFRVIQETSQLHSFIIVVLLQRFLNL